MRLFRVSIFFTSQWVYRQGRTASLKLCNRVSAFEKKLFECYILVNISVDFVDPILATAVEVTVAGLDRAIKQAYPHVQRIFIEIETWQSKEKPKDTKYRGDTR